MGMINIIYPLPGLVNCPKKRTGKIHHAFFMGKLRISFYCHDFNSQLLTSPVRVMFKRENDQRREIQGNPSEKSKEFRAILWPMAYFQTKPSAFLG